MDTGRENMGFLCDKIEVFKTQKYLMLGTYEWLCWIRSMFWTHVKFYCVQPRQSDPLLRTILFSVLRLHWSFICSLTGRGHKLTCFIFSVWAFHNYIHPYHTVSQACVFSHPSYPGHSLLVLVLFSASKAFPTIISSLARQHDNQIHCGAIEYYIKVLYFVSYCFLY